MPSLGFSTLSIPLFFELMERAFIPSYIFRYFSLYSSVTYFLFEICLVLLIVKLRIPFPNTSPGYSTHYVNIPTEILYDLDQQLVDSYLPICASNTDVPLYHSLSQYIKLY